ncbi:MAG: type 1 glutamine amidotransferase domain-containing protein [Pseudomonadota bacterium]
MPLKGKKVIVLAENLYQELELWYPVLRLREESAKVIIVGSGSSSSYTSKFGYPVDVDKEAEEVDIEEYDGIIIPGGYAPDHMRRYPAMVKLVADMYAQRKLVGAICHGAWMLASAGVLRGKTVTGFFSIKDDLINAGATFIDVEVVADGKLVTSRMPDDLPAFMKEVIGILRDREST